eukprot:SAG31_NODE_2070_length_6517_cov_7.896385_4_plen_603_part_00
MNRTGSDEELSLSLGQLRLVCRLDQDIFSTVVVPDEAQTIQTMQFESPRTGDLPAVKSLVNEVMNAGFRLYNSSASGGVDVPEDFYTKYSWAVSSDTDLVHGAIGSTNISAESVGVFLIQPSHEYLNGGPAHAEIATHQDPKSTCFLFHGAGSHYNFRPPVAPLGWRKLIGPAFVRIDGGMDPVGLWNAAVDSTFNDLQRNWPYAWMEHELWAAPKQRGSVRGRLVPTMALDRCTKCPPTAVGYAILGDPVSDLGKLATPECVQALSVLCKELNELSGQKCESHCAKELAKATEPSICTADMLNGYCDGTLARPLDFQGLRYTFWGNVSRDTKTFEIKGVRAGDYSLWVRLPGCLPVQQLLIQNLTVRAGSDTAVGELVVPDKQRGAHRIWQVGVADASVAEFRHGKAAMDHGWMLWLHYPRDFPRGVDFTVGKSDPAVDFNFMQPLLAESNATSSTCQSCASNPPAKLQSTWKVQFDTAALRRYKRLVLTVGILSANGHATGLELLLNGKLAGHVNRTAFQDSESGRITTTHVDIRAWVLSASQPPFEAVLELENQEVASLPATSTLELRLKGPYRNGCSDVQCPSASVLYDFIRLEGDSA